MNPSSGEGGGQPHFELPAEPAAQPESQPQTSEQPPDRALESAAPDEQRVGKAQPQMPAVDPAALALPAANDQTQAAQPADDDDKAAQAGGQESHVVEKEWVTRAKSIISQTQEDPFIQKKEIGKVKADYIKKRFNKTIPSDDTVKA